MTLPDSGTPLSWQLTSPQLYAIVDADYSFIHDGLRGRPSIVASGSSPVHDPIYDSQTLLTHAQSYYYGSQWFGDQIQPSSAAMDTPYQPQPPSASMMRNSSSIPPDSDTSSAWQFEEKFFDVAPALCSQSFPVLSGHDPDTSPHSATSHAGFDAKGVEDRSSAFLASDLSHNLNNFDATFTPENLTQDGDQWTSLYGSTVLTEEPGVIGIPQTSDDVPSYCVSPSFVIPPASYTTNNPNCQTLCLDRLVEGSPQVSTLWDIPSSGWGLGQPETCFTSVDPFSLDFAESPGKIIIPTSPSYHGEDAQVVEPAPVPSPSHVTGPPCEQQSVLPGETIRLCEWQNEDGTLCGKFITRVTLSEHLSTHGIKKMTRNHPTKCGWVRCKKKKSMNRESIVRHIREIHLHRKRPSKRLQEPYS